MATPGISGVTANRAELIAIANSVASEKMIDKGIVIEAMEDAIQRAARTRYGQEMDIRAKLCLLYTSPSPRDRQKPRMPSSA